MPLPHTKSNQRAAEVPFVIVEQTSQTAATLSTCILYDPPGHLVQNENYNSATRVTRIRARPGVGGLHCQHLGQPGASSSLWRRTTTQRAPTHHKGLAPRYPKEASEAGQPERGPSAFPREKQEIKRESPSRDSTSIRLSKPFFGVRIATASLKGANG